MELRVVEVRRGYIRGVNLVSLVFEGFRNLRYTKI